MFIYYNINLLEHIHNMNTINMYASLIQWMQHRIYIVVLLTDVNTWNETWKVLINLIIHEFPKNRRGKNGQFRNLCFSATWVSRNISWIFPSEVAEPGYRNPMNQWITGNALYNFWLLFGIKAFESNGFRSNGFFSRQSVGSVDWRKGSSGATFHMGICCSRFGSYPCQGSGCRPSSPQTSLSKGKKHSKYELNRSHTPVGIVVLWLWTDSYEPWTQDPEDYEGIEWWCRNQCARMGAHFHYDTAISVPYPEFAPRVQVFFGRFQWFKWWWNGHHIAIYESISDMSIHVSCMCMLYVSEIANHNWYCVSSGFPDVLNGNSRILKWRYCTI